MIVCPNCNHQNPEGALQCENCSTPLPATTNCPNCGASVQTDATFCGQCGFNLQVEVSPVASTINEKAMKIPEPLTEMPIPQVEIPTATTASSPIVSPWDDEEEEIDLATEQPAAANDNDLASWLGEETNIMESSSQKSQLSPPWEPSENQRSTPMPWEMPVPNAAELEELFPVDETEFISEPTPTPMAVEPTEVIPPPAPTPMAAEPTEVIPPPAPTPMAAEPTEVTPPPAPTPMAAEPTETEPEVAISAVPEVKASKPQPAISEPEKSFKTPPASSPTRLQTQTAKLFHVQTETTLEVSLNLAVIHLGKPNNQIPPDIDVSGFPNSEVVSRVHADIRVEGDAYFIEDVGSSNGTYINHSPLLSGNRHRLRTGDRIALGKGDLVTFIFQLT
jgi:ribosomal protein L40E